MSSEALGWIHIQINTFWYEYSLRLWNLLFNSFLTRGFDLCENVVKPPVYNLFEYFQIIYKLFQSFQFVLLIYKLFNDFGLFHVSSSEISKIIE